ncbi:ubiquitin-like-conjugating enzyme ATG10 [Hyalella azteca]|nr:ubiquitin-like-conjugating enzyme ATG10 [Hyalella azteca]
MSYITADEFEEYCDEFLKVASRLGDSWIKVINDSNASFLVKKETRTLKARALSETENTRNNSEKSLQGADFSLTPSCDIDASITSCPDAAINNSDSDDMKYDIESDPSEFEILREGTAVTFEYNILYSFSYSVPILTFEAFNSSGKPLSLEDVWDRVVDSHFVGQIQPRRWESLTMMEHPVKGSPCYGLHPCKTAQLLQQVEDIRSECSRGFNGHTEDCEADNAAKDDTSVPCGTVTTEEEPSRVSNQTNTKMRNYKAQQEVSATVGEDLGLGQLKGAAYIISWLSMMGPAIGLKLDIRYFTVK